MMTGAGTLQAELDRWQQDLTTLTEDCSSDSWTEPERLLFTLQRTAAVYRERILPCIVADRYLLLTTAEARQALAVCTTAIAEELGRLVDRLDELRRELVRLGRTPELQLRAAETLASIHTLATIMEGLR